MLGHNFAVKADYVTAADHTTLPTPVPNSTFKPHLHPTINYPFHPLHTYNLPLEWHYIVAFCLMILKNMHNQSRGPGTSGGRGGTSPPAGGGRRGTSPPVGGGRGHEVGTRPPVVVVEGFCVHLLLGFQSTYCWGSSPPTAGVQVHLLPGFESTCAGVQVHMLLGFESTYCWASSPHAGIRVHLLPGFKSTYCRGSSPPAAGVRVHLLPEFKSTYCRGSSPPAAVSKLGQFHSPHIACVFWKRH